MKNDNIKRSKIMSKEEFDRLYSLYMNSETIDMDSTTEEVGKFLDDNSNGKKYYYPVRFLHTAYVKTLLLANGYTDKPF
jgi:predicted solute-binding protein